VRSVRKIKTILRQKLRPFFGYKKRALVDPVHILSAYFNILKNKKIIKNILEIKIFSKK